MIRRTVFFVLAILLAVSMNRVAPTDAKPTNGGCSQNIPVFTTDLAPSNGILVFRAQLGSKDHRQNTPIFKTWNVAAGQRINNDVVFGVPAPRWATLWWRPDGDSTWHLLPSQYWQGDEMETSLYGVACGGGQPSYHTSFSSAIPENKLPLYRGCPAVPKLISPSSEATLNTLVPLLKWSHNYREPRITGLQLEIAEDSAFAYTRYVFSTEVSPLDKKQYRPGVNLEPLQTYYWRVFFTCGEVSGPHATWSFTTGSGGVILPAPKLISPLDASTVSPATVLLQWEAVDGAVEYLVEWHEIGQSWWWCPWTSRPQYRVDYGLNPNTTYEWRVAARNSYAIGQYATGRFTTSSNP